MSSGKDPDTGIPVSPGEDPNPQVARLRRVQTREMVNITQALKDAAEYAQNAPQIPRAVLKSETSEAASPASMTGQRKPASKPMGGNSPTPSGRPAAKRPAASKIPKPAKPAKRSRPTTLAQDAINAKTGLVGVTSSGLPAMPPRVNPAAKRMISRFLASDTPPTQAINIVDRLRGTPYANPKVNAAQDASARKTLEFALDLAETMFRYGAGSLEVETSVIAVTAALGLRHTDVDITNQSIHLNFSPPEGESYSMLRVVRSWTTNFAGLAQVHRLVSDIISGGVTRQQSVDRLRAIARKPKPFPRWMVASAAGAFAALFVVFIGGSLTGAALAFVSSIAVGQVIKYASRWRVPEFFSIATSTFVVTAIAILFHALRAPMDPSIVVAGGILLLLPSSRFVSALQDAINGFPVTASGRFFSAALTYAAILTGIMTALVSGRMLGAPELDVSSIDVIVYPGWLLAALVVLAVMAGGVTEQSEPKLLLPIGAIALLGYMILLGIQALGVGDRAAPAVAATFVGFAGRWAAYKLRAPQLVLAAPAIVFLLPGLMIFRSMYGIVFDVADMSGAMVQMFTAFTIMMAIAGGVVFGDTIARPLIGAEVLAERRNIRRR
ncbi:threonine/serine exporter family protein [Paeniglutamicibacter gangotriensis]|uniref:Inner membrane protein YjjP n=2 Tax=Paeniglutamicibacter gangotriensis TaxID=254787 RepID=M7MN74_9MICC|nr:threonine/serine exporter family protein [Paeniglutamicibacter gangotriensis]EMQ97782.1 Inner membrane protein YjjP [Paeniglutamicibacter gangotriensis Lz1y]